MDQFWQAETKSDKFEPLLTSKNKFWQDWTSLGLIQYDMTCPFIDIRDMIYDYLTSISDNWRQDNNNNKKSDSKMGAYAPIKSTE